MAAATTSGVAVWGVQGRVNSVSGIVTDIEQSAEVQIAPEYNEIGAVVKQTKYDEHTTLSATVEVAAGTNPPEVGAQITINGKQGYVTNARVVESNQAYRKIVVQAECWKNCKQTSTP
jgi:hypothetical protein